jgi:hypothetical protein
MQERNNATTAYYFDAIPHTECETTKFRSEPGFTPVFNIRHNVRPLLFAIGYRGYSFATTNLGWLHRNPCRRLKPNARKAFCPHDSAQLTADRVGGPSQKRLAIDL